MLQRAILGAVLLSAVLMLLGYRAATAEAVQRNLTMHVASWPEARAPMRLVLIADLHVSEPEMPTARLDAIVARVNALRPDCVLIAGDLISDDVVSTRHVPYDEALAPLAALRPRIATMAVLGNHDHWRSATDARATLRRYGVVVLSNDAARCGALTIGGVDDAYTRHADVAVTQAAMRTLGGTGIMLSHSPDVFPQVSDAPLTLAGHTHCGQLMLPLIGPPPIPSKYGRRYQCGIIREGGRTLVVTAGLGTSSLPLRWDVPPDFWVVTVGR